MLETSRCCHYIDRYLGAERGYVRSRRWRLETRKAIATRLMGSYLVPRAGHDKFFAHTFYQSIIITKTIELASRSSTCWIETKSSRRACSAGHCTVHDRGNKLRVRSAKGHIVVFFATLAYIRRVINIV